MRSTMNVLTWRSPAHLPRDGADRPRGFVRGPGRRGVDVDLFGLPIGNWLVKPGEYLCGRAHAGSGTRCTAGVPVRDGARHRARAP